ncbi:hypothetical protein DFH09DRAFT_1076960 [Mycena vulgaris]|nr:hypothetical protein DFH09DRAFT_1076960 [Mycena vulgaris]
MHSSQAPFLLCRMCSSWRAISLSTPALRCSVHVAFAGAPRDESSPPNVVEKRRSALGIWLTRAGEEDVPLLHILKTKDVEWNPDPALLQSYSIPPQTYAQSLSLMPMGRSAFPHALGVISQICCSKRRGRFSLWIWPKQLNSSRKPLRRPQQPGSIPREAIIALRHLESLAVRGDSATDARFNIMVFLDCTFLPVLLQIELRDSWYWTTHSFSFPCITYFGTSTFSKMLGVNGFSVSWSGYYPEFELFWVTMFSERLSHVARCPSPC